MGDEHTLDPTSTCYRESGPSWRAPTVQRGKDVPQAGLMNLEAHTMDSVSSGPSGRSSGLVTSQVRAGLGTSHYTEVTEFFEWVLNIVRKPRDVVACRAFS